MDETVHEESRKRMPSKVYHRIVSIWNFLERSLASKSSTVSLFEHLLNGNSNTAHKLYYRVAILLTAPQRNKRINTEMPASYATTRQVLVGDSSIVNKNKIRQNHMDDQFVVYSNQFHLRCLFFLISHLPWEEWFLLRLGQNTQESKY